MHSMRHATAVGAGAVIVYLAYRAQAAYIKYLNRRRWQHINNVIESTMKVLATLNTNDSANNDISRILSIINTTTGTNIYVNLIVKSIISIRLLIPLVTALPVPCPWRRRRSAHVWLPDTHDIHNPTSTATLPAVDIAQVNRMLAVPESAPVLGVPLAQDTNGTHAVGNVRQPMPGYSQNSVPSIAYDDNRDLPYPQFSPQMNNLIRDLDEIQEQDRLSRERDLERERQIERHLQSARELRAAIDRDNEDEVVVSD